MIDEKCECILEDGKLHLCKMHYEEYVKNSSVKIDDILYSCPPGMDMAEWVKEKWNPIPLFGGVPVVIQTEDKSETSSI